MKKQAYDYSKLGTNIRMRRLDKDLTQSSLAHLAGCSASKISSLESGKCGISVELLVKLARALNCRPAELVEGV